jgi:hypothetical protein
MRVDANVMVIVPLVVVVTRIGIGAWMVVKTPDSANLESRKVSFAAATFTGALLLIVTDGGVSVETSNLP